MISCVGQSFLHNSMYFPHVMAVIFYVKDNPLWNVVGFEIGVKGPIFNS